MLKPFAPEPALTERVRDAIVAAIVDGTYMPGERLAQEDLAQRLGVSRQPVSHALNVLKEQGVLIEFGKKGLTVAPMAPEHLLHLYQVRGSLDALAARLAAARVRDGIADGKVLADLGGLVERQIATTDRSNVRVQVEADVAFHVAIYKLSGNPMIEEMARPQWVHFRRSMQAVLDAPGAYPPIWRQHKDIYEAIRRGDAEAASRLALEHAENAAQKTAARLRDQSSN